MCATHQYQGDVNYTSVSASIDDDDVYVRQLETENHGHTGGLRG